MGKAALVIFLASMAMVPLSLTLVIAAAASIFRTFRYAQKDFESYRGLFSEKLEKTSASRERVLERLERIGEEFRQAGENIEETRAALEDLANPTLGSLLRSFLPRG